MEPGESYTHSHTINMNDRGLLPGEYYLVIFTNHIIEGEEPYVTTEANRENNVAEIHFWVHLFFFFYYLSHHRL